MAGSAPATALADVIVPEVFSQYVINRTAELSALMTSGIVAAVPDVAIEKGKTLEMPFWSDLDDDDEVIDDTADLTPGGIDADQDTAAVLIRGKAWGASDLSAMLAGDDPARAIGDLVAAWWARKQQATLISVLAGAMSTTVSGGSMAAATLNISTLSPTTDRVFTPEGFLDACQLLGDAQDSLAGTLMHSSTYNLLLKDDLIDFIKPSEGGMPIATYLGKRVVVDDSCPKTSAGVYTTYIFGPGAIGYVEGTPKTPSATWRDELKGGGTEYLASRRKFVMHPRGVRWIGTPSGPTATNAELATGAKWKRVWEQKQVRIVRFIHKNA